MGRKRPDLAVKAVKKDLHSKEDIDNFLVKQCGLSPNEARMSRNESLVSNDHRLVEMNGQYYLPGNEPTSVKSDEEQKTGGEEKMQKLDDSTEAFLRVASRVFGEENDAVKKRVLVFELAKDPAIGKRAEGVANYNRHSSGRLESAGWGELKLSKKGLTEVLSLKAHPSTKKETGSTASVKPKRQYTRRATPKQTVVAKKPKVGKKVAPKKKAATRRSAAKKTPAKQATTSGQRKLSRGIRVGVTALLDALEQERAAAAAEAAAAQERLDTIEEDMETIRSRFQ